MSTSTTNLDLVKPDSNELYDIGVFNGNADKIDAFAGGLATVASTGAYSDLSGKPSLAAVATSGAYSDLSGKPTVDSEISSSSTNAVQNAAVSAALTALLNNVLGPGTTLTPTATNKLDLDSINTFDPSLPSFGRITVGASAAANVLNLPNIGATYGFVLERSAIFGTAGRECQTLRFNATQEVGNIYERCKYSNGWGSWYKFTGTAVV